MGYRTDDDASYYSSGSFPFALVWSLDLRVTPALPGVTVDVVGTSPGGADARPAVPLGRGLEDVAPELANRESSAFNARALRYSCQKIKGN